MSFDIEAFLLSAMAAVLQDQRFGINLARLLAPCGNRARAICDLLYHLCRGDINHRHSVEPADRAGKGRPIGVARPSP